MRRPASTPATLREPPPTRDRSTPMFGPWDFMAFGQAILDMLGQISGLTGHDQYPLG